MSSPPPALSPFLPPSLLPHTFVVSDMSRRAFFHSASACVTVMIFANSADLMAVTCCVTALARAAVAAACMLARPWMALSAEEACWAAAKDWFCRGEERGADETGWCLPSGDPSAFPPSGSLC